MRKLIGVVQWLAGAGVLACLWQLASCSGPRGLRILPGIDRIAAEMFRNAASFQAVVATLYWAFIAWFCALVVTLTVSLSLRHLSILGRSLSILFAAGRSLPSVIAIPLFAASIGFGRISAFACAAFLAVSYSVPGFTQALQESLEAGATLAEALGLGNVQRLSLVTLPSIGRAINAIGVYSFGIALVVTVAGEMLLVIPGSAGARVAQLAWLLRMGEVYAIVAWLILGSLLLSVLTTALPGMLMLPVKLSVRRKKRWIPDVLERPSS